MKLKDFILIVTFVFIFSEGRAQNTLDIIRESLQELQINSSHENFRITSEHQSSASGVVHIYFQQLVSGIPIMGTESSVHLSTKGVMIVENIQFISSEKLVLSNKSPVIISPQKAVELVARQMGYLVTAPIEVIEKERNVFDEIWLTDGGISAREIKAQLVYTLNEDHTYDLVWELDVLQPDYLHWWVFEVNAENGLILSKEDSMRNCYSHDHTEDTLDYNKNLFDIENYETETDVESAACDECYEVFAFPLESPYFGDRTIEENASHPIASPYGWHDIDGVPGADYTETNGNNVNAFEGNNVFGYQPDGGSNLDFTGFDFGTEFSVNTPYIDASITNLFYWTNIIHDITYQYGFDEVAGNFQENNYDRGGSDGDPVIAHGQSINRPCNASFNTQEDGVSPLMIINICNSKDGDFDSTVIAHEYGHGLIARLTGGAVINNCFRHAENPSEGWCDWLGVVLTIKPEDTALTPRSIANYLTSRGANGPGIRPYPYSTDMNLNPLTYANVPTENGVHNVGAIWGEILWEVTWTLVNSYGFDPDIYNFTGDLNQDAGNIMAMAIIIEGLKLTECQPGFVEARDAILLAAEAIYGAQVVCEIWPAFARRGLGFLADQGDSDVKGDEIISFRIPLDGPIFEAEYEPFCLQGGIYEGLSGGLPLGGFYSGPGVIDNEDGVTYSFDPSIAGEGSHTVTYHFPETICAPATIVTKDNLEVYDDIDSPSLDCLTDLTVTLDPGETYILGDFTGLVTTTDNCPGEIEISQEPLVGTQMDEGTTEIIFTAIDGAGNRTICTSLLSVTYTPIVDEQINLFTFYPNPARDAITIINTLELKIESVELRDMMGRLVDTFVINNTEMVNELSIANLSSGSYFVSVILQNELRVMRLLKH